MQAAFLPVKYSFQVQLQLVSTVLSLINTFYWNTTFGDTLNCQVKWMVSRNETFPSRDSRLVSKKCGSLQKVSKHCCGCANTVAIFFFFFFKLRFPLPLVFQVSMHGRYHNLPVIKPHQDSLSNLCVRSNYGIFFHVIFFSSSFHEK